MLVLLLRLYEWLGREIDLMMNEMERWFADPRSVPVWIIVGGWAVFIAVVLWIVLVLA